MITRILNIFLAVYIICFVMFVPTMAKANDNPLPCHPNQLRINYTMTIVETGIFGVEHNIHPELRIIRKVAKLANYNDTDKLKVRVWHLVNMYCHDRKIGHVDQWVK